MIEIFDILLSYKDFEVQGVCETYSPSPLGSAAFQVSSVARGSSAALWSLEERYRVHGAEEGAVGF